MNTICLVFATSVALTSQSRTIMVFDLRANSIDSIIIDLSTIDTTKQHDRTHHFIGEFSSIIETLEQDTPTENLSSTMAKSTKRRRVHLDYDLNSFPIRTSVKTSYIENDTLKDLCSGSMISRKHVLTVAHCHLIKDMDSLFFDSLIVHPVFDNGQPNPNFGSHVVEKIYAFKGWDLYSEDFAILELAEDIGKSTGWIGIGYENDDDVGFMCTPTQ